LEKAWRTLLGFVDKKRIFQTRIGVFLGMQGFSKFLPPASDSAGLFDQQGYRGAEGTSLAAEPPALLKAPAEEWAP
jgi:hypothetical protein